jgi:hypothetical protein
MPIAETLPNGYRPKQIEGALRITQGNGVVLADEPGAGKTLQAMFAWELKGFSKCASATLILCNVTGCQLTWAPEIAKRILRVYPHVKLIDLTDTRGRRTMPSVAAREERLADQWMDARESEQPVIVLANYDLVRITPKGVKALPTLFEIPWNMVIIDEAHLVLPMDDDNPQKMTQFWRGLARLDCYRHGVVRLPITGTPDRGGRLERRYGTYKWLHPWGHKDYKSWVNYNFRLRWDEVITGKDPRTGKLKKINVPTILGLKSEPAWNAYQAEHMVRRTKREMLTGLPPKQWAGDGGIDLPMTPIQAKFYDDAIADLKAQREQLLADGDEAAAAGVRLQMALRARQAAVCSWDRTDSHWKPLLLGRDGSAQLAWILDEFMEPRGYLRDGFDANLGKVVIVSYFTEELDWLRAELAAEGVHAEILAGDTPAPDKKAIEAAFQNGDLRVVLLSGHLGVSINLDAADDMIFIDYPHKDPDKVEQAEDRIHRASSNHQVTYWRLIPQGTIIQEMVRDMDTRYATTRASYDGSRGASYHREFIADLLTAKAA